MTSVLGQTTHIATPQNHEAKKHVLEARKRLLEGNAITLDELKEKLGLES